MKRLSPIAAIIAAMLFACSGNAKAQSQFFSGTYSVTSLGTLAVPTGINDNSIVAGSASNNHLVSWSNGTITDLGNLGGTYGQVYGINVSGQIVGYSETSGNANMHAFSYLNASMTDLFSGSSYNSIASAINDSGAITGYYWAYNITGHHPFEISGGTFTDLSGHGLNVNAYPCGINASGEIAGWGTTSGNTSWLYSGGVQYGLGTLGGTQSYCTAINQPGQIVGYSNTTGNTNLHAYLWSPTTPNGTSGTMYDLGTFGLDSNAQSINAWGQIVGYSTYSSGAQHGFIYQGGTMYDLNNKISPTSGWTITLAQSINNLGQIVARATYTDGNNYGVLLTPQ